MIRCGEIEETCNDAGERPLESQRSLPLRPFLHSGEKEKRIEQENRIEASLRR